MSEEKVTLIYEARGAAQFAKAAKDAELALRQQARSLNDSALALKKEIQELRSAEAPNRALIASKQKLLAANNLEMQSIRQKISSMRLDSVVTSNAAKSTTALAVATKGASAAMLSFGRTFLPLLAALSAGQIVKAGDDIKLLRAKIRDVLPDTRSLDTVFNQLVASANRTGSSVDSVAQAFVRLAPAAGRLGVANEDLIRFIETFNKMGALAGATSTELSNALIQLSQGIAANRLSGDELRSVMEQMPRIAETIAKSMDIPFEEFKEAAEEGKITAQEVFTAILNEANAVDERFKALPENIGRSMTRASTSIALASGAIDKLTDASSITAKVIDGFANIVNGFTEILSKSSDGVRGLGKAIGDLVGEFSIVGIALKNTENAFNALLGLLGASAWGNFEFVLFAMASGLDRVGLAAQIAANNVIALKNSFSEGTTAYQISDSKNKFLESQFNVRQRNRAFELAFGSSGTGKGSGTPKIPLSPGGGTKKSDAGRKEKEQISEIKEQLSDALKDIDLQFEERILKLGAFASELDKLNLEKERNQTKRQEISQTSEKLLSLQIKTAEAAKEKQKALKDLTQSLKENGNGLLQLGNRAAQLDDQVQESIENASRESQKILLENNIQRQQVQLDSIRRQAQQAFEDGEITIQQFYDTERDLIQRNAILEQEKMDQRLRHLQSELDSLHENEEGEERRLEILNQIKQVEQDILGLKTETQDALQKANEEEGRKIKEAGQRLGDSFEQATSQAIQDALSGQGVGNALKNFAKALKNALLKELADALAARIRKLFDPFFSALGGAFNNLRGVSGSGGSVATGGLSSSGGLGLGTVGKGLSKAGALQVLGGALIAGGSIYAGRKLGGGLKGAAIGGIGGAVGGGLAGAALGSFLVPGLGTAAGALIGAGIGGGAGVLGGAGKKLNPITGAVGGGLLGAGAGALLGLAVPVIGPLLGAIGGGLLGGGGGGLFGLFSKKKRKEAEKQAKLQEFDAQFQAIVSSVDTNDLGSIKGGLRSILTTHTGSNSGVKLKRQYAIQLKQALEARKKAIAEGIKEIERQNEDLRAAIALVDATPGEAIALNRGIEERQIKSDIEKLLEEYKDSEEAKTKILEQETLRRQQLLKDEQEAARQSVQDLRDLLAERDDIENSNVFTRLKTREQRKSDDLKEIDRELAEKFLEVQKNLELGIQPLDSLGANQILDQVRAIAGVQNSLQIIINEAKDPAYVDQKIQEAFAAFSRKVLGATA